MVRDAADEDNSVRSPGVKSFSEVQGAIFHPLAAGVLAAKRFRGTRRGLDRDREIGYHFQQV